MAAFRVYQKDVGTPDSAMWHEDYNKATDDPEKWAVDTIAEFNATLRPGERPRELIRVEMIEDGEAPPLSHDWSKTNLVTIVDRGGWTYDTYQCRRCGAQGRRYGLGSIQGHDKRGKKPCEVDLSVRVLPGHAERLGFYIRRLRKVER